VASIRGIDAGDMAAAASLGRVIRQVVWADRSGGESDGIAAGVSAALVGRDSWLGRARGPENVVLVRGERSGTTVFAGQGAGGDATAVAVVSDLLALAHQQNAPRPWPAQSAGGASAGAALPHYVRVSRPPAAGAHSPQRLLEGAGLAVDRVLARQEGGAERWAALVRPCRRSDVERALAPFLPAGAPGQEFISLPLFDLDA
jgi:homoserine dehydrogenase